MYYLLIAFLLLFSPVQAQQFAEIEGIWNGAIDLNGNELAIRITFSYTDGELDGTLDIPQQQAFNLPIEVTRAEGEEITFQFETGSGPAIFDGIWSEMDESIIGEYVQNSLRFPFYLNKESRSGLPSSNQMETDVTLPTRAGVVGGTLLLQENPAPLIILLTGSGSQDRDETVVGFGVFNELSRQLFQNGFSSFRYDDRGIGTSTGESDATLKELAEDLVDIVSYLESEYGDQFIDVIFLGHSQGGLVASLAASETSPKGIIFMATPFLSGDQIINEQIVVLSEAQGISEEIMNENLEYQEEIYEVVRTGSSWETIEESLRNRLQEQINQLPDAQIESLGDLTGFIDSQINRQLSAAKSRWFKSMIEFQPAAALQELDVPLLALFGEKDMQVYPDSNVREIVNIRGNSDINIEYTVIPDANHLFQSAESGLPSEYGTLEREFADGLIDAIVEWLNGLE